MIPVLRAAQVREADARTIAREPIASIGLMERAATRCFERIMHHHARGAFGEVSTRSFLVVSGMGNNGGDGAVIARLLKDIGLPVRLVRVRHREEPSPDNATNFQRAADAGVPVSELGEGDGPLDIMEQDVVVDALFGTGLNAPAHGLAAAVIGRINAAHRPVVSIDLPSGLFAEDNAGNDPVRVVRATLTLTFEVPKLALLLPENAPFTGEWSIVPIGLDAGFISSLEVDHHVMEEADVLALLPDRPRYGHKGTFGHALIMAGGRGRMGAAMLATGAALRSGAGLVTAHVPGCGLDLMQRSCPEAMCSTDENGTLIGAMPTVAPYPAVGVGPGIGTAPETATVVKRLLQDARVPLVLDADALNILAANPTWTAFLPQGTILTPHPREFDRLAGSVPASGYERLERARDFARRNGCIMVLKGAWTAVCGPGGKVFFNPTGNPGMAKGGSGDALTGLLTGLLAQGCQPLRAALLGVYLHGLAGDLAARHRGMDGMTAGDLVAALPEAWQHLRNASQESVQ